MNIKIKNKGGRPPKFKTEIELEERCRNYFKKIIKDKIFPSKAGLRVFLGLDKSLISDYKKKFPNPIKKAEDLIEEAWIQRLSGMGATGAIFYLKNAFKEDYKDRYNADITSGGKPFPILGNVSKNNSGSKNNSAPKED